jgi:hypothetical protein
MSEETVSYKLVKKYPHCQLQLNEVITTGDPEEISLMRDHPEFFRKLKFYENKTIEELLNIKYVKVIKYVGYYELGAIVPVAGVEFSDTKGLTFFLGDRIGRKYNPHPHPADHLDISDKEEFERYEYQRHNKKL